MSTLHDETLRVWDTRKEARSLNPFSDRTSHGLANVIFSGNGEYIAASTITQSDIFVWDGTNGSSLTTFAGHTDYIHSLAFSPDSTLLASVSEGDGVFLWDLGKESPPRKLSNSDTTKMERFSSFTTPADRVRINLRIVFSATGKQLAVVSETTTSADGQSRRSFRVKIWDVSKCKGEDTTEVGIEIFQSKRNGGYLPHFIRFAPHEPLAFARHWDHRCDSKVIVWDRVNDTVDEHDYDGDIDAVLIHNFYVREGWIVSGRTNRRLLWMPESRRSGCGVSIATHGDMFAVGSGGGVFSLFDMSPLISL